MELNLGNVKWQAFTLQDIFNISASLSSIDKNKLSKKAGKTPYVTRSEKNNGFDGFVGEQLVKYALDEGNVLTIGLDTQTVFYQPHEFYTGQNIQVLRCKQLNKHVALFLIPLIKRQMAKFNWGGNGATLTRLRRSKILLPVNDNNEPDFSFMEDYIKLLEHEQLKKYRSFKG